MFNRARAFDNEFSPTGVWNFQESLADSSGNSFDVVLAEGTLRYAEMLPGLGGIVLDGLRSFEHRTTGTALGILGDMTGIVLAVINSATILDARLFGYISDSGTSLAANNTLYSLGIGSASNKIGYRYLHRSGVYVLREYTPTGFGVDLFTPVFLAFTRTSNVIQIYRNAEVMGSASTALVAPATGTSAKFKVGGGSLGFARMNAIIGGVKIIPSSLTANQIKAEYNKTLGPVLGYR